ncbi:hypothetical protein [Nonomuraea sp. NPDC050783]|uniref:hypothetical protein n=1 Tax=Nonomuraea sp. NPDC050783 TaxID=3154634 RepID=UPI0034669F1B
MGDSLAAGTHGPSPGYANMGWPDRLASILRRVQPDLAYLNTATIGSTAADTLSSRLGRVMESGPDLLHISYGTHFSAAGQAVMAAERVKALALRTDEETSA